MKAEKNADKLLVYLNGEIDHCHAEQLRKEIESLLRDQKIRQLTLDFSRVSFMDSSGIGMLIGRYKTMAARDGCVIARRMSPAVKQLFYMAGLHRIMMTEQESEGGKIDEK